MYRKPLYCLIAGLLLLYACGSPQPEAQKGREIHMVYTDWAESVAMTHLASHLLERNLGYKVVSRLTDIENVFDELAAGEADVFLDAWLPATHAGFMELYEYRLEDLGPNYEHARTGLVVPAYMDISSIVELREVYEGPIAGIDSNAGIMQNTRRAIEIYNLDNELLVLSDAEMAKKLEDAIRRRESIVITGWKPHWLFYRYELKYLHDPENIYMATENIHTIGRIGFREAYPAAVKFFERMVLSEKQMNSLLFEMQLHEDPLIGVRNWVKENEFIVNQWTRGLREEREKIM